MSDVHARVAEVTERIVKRSSASRKAYETQMQKAAEEGPRRDALSCGNLAHGIAACPAQDKEGLSSSSLANLAIVSAYNDMLSAHQPYEHFPALLKEAAREAGATAQFAGGVPAMCDGVTQGRVPMQLSLYSREVIAMATAIALSHDMFDGALMLGVCDKIVPGLLMGALRFGYLPVLFVPAGPMPSGLPNEEKAKVRQQYAAGEIGRPELLAAESAAYHSPGTCTFYGTANSNQLLMEVMGLHLPGSSFVPPNTALRDALTQEAAKQVTTLTKNADGYTPLWQIVDARCLVNAIVALLATGGSTNHTLHLVAIARAAGLMVTWQDFEDLSEVTPLLTRVYPNGAADINHFHSAGGIAFLIRELLSGGLLHDDVMTIMGQGYEPYLKVPELQEGNLIWQDIGEAPSRDETVLRPLSKPFQAQGGLKLLKGNLGTGIIKTSAVDMAHRRVEASAEVFDDQDGFVAAFEKGLLNKDFVAVIRNQGPRANGMPELHKLTPLLGLLQGQGYKVALVTDGRMSGASGKVPAAIHLSPEGICGGVINKVKTGDMIILDAEAGLLDVKVEVSVLEARPLAGIEEGQNDYGFGRELLAPLRQVALPSEEGALASPAIAAQE